MTRATIEADRSVAIADAFVNARRAAAALPDYPGVPPQDLDEAYAIQAHAIAAWDEPVIGWKVGRIPAAQEAALGADRLAGPIFVSQLFEDAADGTDMPVFLSGFAAVEAEFVAVLAADPPVGKRHYTLEEAAALVARVHCGIEIASSPLPTINALGSAVTVSDFGNNAGLIVGPEIPDWRKSGFEQWPVVVTINGEVAGKGKAETMPDGPIGAVRFLLETAAARNLSLVKGSFISTGAVSGVHEAIVGSIAQARFDDRIEIDCRLTAALSQDA